MKSVGRKLVPVLCIVLIFGGIGLLSAGASSHQLSLAETKIVLGGTLNPLDLTNANCDPPSADCSYIECDDDDECPEGTAKKYQHRPNYPSATKAGTAWETTKAKNYDCNYARACANPCLQSTVDDKYYCAGPVGPNIALPAKAGIEGDKAAAPEA